MQPAGASQWVCKGVWHCRFWTQLCKPLAQKWPSLQTCVTVQEE